MRTNLLHKCTVNWNNIDKTWVVRDRKCGEFAENKNWQRAVLVGIYHFKIFFEESVSKVLRDIK